MLKQIDEDWAAEAPQDSDGLQSSPSDPAADVFARPQNRSEEPEAFTPTRERPTIERDPPSEEERPPRTGGATGGELPKARRGRRSIVLGSVLLGLAAASAGILYWNDAQHFESTDDAFIASRQFAVAPKVTGYITDVLVTDNQHVAAGAVIAHVDDRDYRIALAQADAQVAAAQAGIKNIDAQMRVQQAQVAASQAQVQQAQAALVFAQQQAARYEDLAQRGSGTVQSAQQYASQLLQQQAALKSAQAALNVAQRQIEALDAQQASATASLAQATAQRDQAQLNLSYTAVTVAQAGRVVNLTAAAGEFAQAGANLAMFVPDDVWVTANFKETQLDAMRPGQPASVRIDAYPERDFHGHVASVQPGSGTAFSLLPAENATGNYVKVIQRVPVKIVLDNAPVDVALGPGMSVTPSVRIDPTPSLYERLTASIDRLWGRT